MCQSPVWQGCVWVWLCAFCVLQSWFLIAKQTCSSGFSDNISEVCYHCLSPEAERRWLIQSHQVGFYAKGKTKIHDLLTSNPIFYPFYQLKSLDDIYKLVILKIKISHSFLTVIFTIILLMRSNSVKSSKIMKNVTHSTM